VAVPVKSKGTSFADVWLFNGGSIVFGSIQDETMGPQYWCWSVIGEG